MKKIVLQKKVKLTHEKGDSMAITKRPNGSWLVSIYQPDKARIRKTFKTRDEARKYEVIICRGTY